MAKTKLDIPQKKKKEPKEPQIKPAEDVKTTGEAKAKKAMLEREIRRYVKRSGGFRGNMHKDNIAEAKELLDAWSKTYGPRNERDGWDDTIHVKGYDNADHYQNTRHVKPRFA